MDQRRTNDTDSVITRLRREPWRFSLEQSIRILQSAGDVPELRGEVGLAFAPSEMGALQDGSLQVRSLGPGGADGMLPYGWQEWLQQAAQDKNAAPQDFLNLFQQRVIQHDARSLSLYRLATPYARREQAPGMAVTRALSGFTSRDVAQPYFAHSGLLINRRRSTAGFIALVAAVLEVPVRVEEFVGGWKLLPVASQGRIGCRLGRDSVAGRHVWNQHASLRVHLNVNRAPRWRAFLPGGDGFHQLSALGALWFGAGITLVLEMRGTLTLDSCLQRGKPPRLGHTAQLKGSKPASFCCQQPLKENNTWI